MKIEIIEKILIFVMMVITLMSTIAKLNLNSARSSTILGIGCEGVTETER